MTAIVIDALAVYRLWRLAALDSITEPARDRFASWAARRYGVSPPPWPVVLLGCPWCFGFWLTVAAVATRQAFPQAWRPVAAALACSTLVGLVAEAAEAIER